MKRVFFIIAMLWANISFAQTVTDVDAWQEGNNIVVGYSLEAPGNIPKNMQIRVLPSCSTDGGKTFYALKSVSGDLTVSPGTGKRIIWNVLNDFDEFVENNVLFKVEILMMNAGNGSESLKGADYYRRGQECERAGKYADAIKYYRKASEKGYRQADERIKALQLHFW